MAESNTRQVGGKHYRTSYQHWDFVHDVEEGYLIAQVIKYVTRHEKKGGLEDLLKAEHFLQKAMERQAGYITETVREYAYHNDLGMVESSLISMLILREWRTARQDLECLKAVYENAEPQPHGYVDQDR